MIILLLQSGGMLIIFNIEQAYVHTKMTEKLKDSKTSFEKIRITNEDYKKSRINRNEIFYKGKMYDIKSSAEDGEMIELLVIHDNEEDNILHKIKKIFTGSSQPENKISNHIHHLISLSYISHFPEGLHVIPSRSANLFYQANAGIVTTCLETLFPPPKQV